MKKDKKESGCLQVCVVLFKSVVVESSFLFLTRIFVLTFLSIPEGLRLLLKQFQLPFNLAKYYRAETVPGFTPVGYVRKSVNEALDIKIHYLFDIRSEGRRQIPADMIGKRPYDRPRRRVNSWHMKLDHMG